MQGLKINERGENFHPFRYLFFNPHSVERSVNKYQSYN